MLTIIGYILVLTVFTIWYVYSLLKLFSWARKAE